jgi:hypothetical protein
MTTDENTWQPVRPAQNGSVTIEFFDGPNGPRPPVTYQFAEIDGWVRRGGYVVVWLDESRRERAQYLEANVRNVLVVLNSDEYVEGLSRYKQFIAAIPAEIFYRLETYDHDKGMVMHHVAESRVVAEELRAAHVESGWTVKVFERIGHGNEPEDWAEFKGEKL